MSEKSKTPPTLSGDTLDRAEWFCIATSGSFGFRFGPFNGATIGKIITEATARNVPMLYTANCGAELDWETIEDLCGQSPLNLAAPDMLTALRRAQSVIPADSGEPGSVSAQIADAIAKAERGQ